MGLAVTAWEATWLPLEAHTLYRALWIKFAQWKLLRRSRLPLLVRVQKREWKRLNHLQTQPDKATRKALGLHWQLINRLHVAWLFKCESLSFNTQLKVCENSSVSTSITILLVQIQTPSVWLSDNFTMGLNGGSTLSSLFIYSCSSIWLFDLFNVHNKLGAQYAKSHEWWTCE